VVVDPRSGDLYLTEDASGPTGLVYRFEPSDRTRAYGALRNGGALTAMSYSRNGTHVPDLSVFSSPGTVLQVDWVAVPDPLAATTSTRKQLANTDVTRSRKFEGAWWGNSGMGGGAKAHIVCSFARLSDSLAEHDGQVWGYDPDRQTRWPTDPVARRTNVVRHLAVPRRSCVGRPGRSHDARSSSTDSGLPVSATAPSGPAHRSPKPRQSVAPELTRRRAR
jgi:hypothetical protein